MESASLPHARLTWLVGPPGAGKSTWAALQQHYPRVVELTHMLGPLVNGPRIRSGVLTANGRMVGLIRELERHPQNQGLPGLLVVAGLIPEEVVLPVRDGEAVLLMRPARERWWAQLKARPVSGGSSGQYDDYSYSEAWFDRFASWAKHPGVVQLEAPFEARLLGQVVGQEGSGGVDG